MPPRKIVFTNNQKIELAARLELPIDQAPKAYALFAHCFTCNKNLTAVRQIASALTRQGFGVVRFDFTGLGESEGDFADTNFSSNVEDLVAAANFMTKELAAPKLLIGHSLGGVAVLAAAHQLASVEAVATIGAPAAPEHVQHLFQNSLDEIDASGIAEVLIGGRSFTIKKQFIDDLADKNFPQRIKNLGKALLVLHSPQDSTVGVENAKEIYQAAMHPKSFVSLDGADHLLTKKLDAAYVGDVIGTWAKRYISMPESTKLQSRKQVVVQIDTEGFTTEIKVGNHSLRADEPESVGGNDYGPTPYDLLLTSLGTCTAMTLRMYANRKKWSVDEITVHLNHNKQHVQDCENCEASTSKIDYIEKCIEIKGNLDVTQKTRLLEIADRCPVHRTLHSTIKVETRLLE